MNAQLRIFSSEIFTLHLTCAKPQSQFSKWHVQMTLYTYFKKKTGNSLLPDVKGQLSTVVPSSYISEANKKVSEAGEKGSLYEAHS